MSHMEAKERKLESSVSIKSWGCGVDPALMGTGLFQLQKSIRPRWWSLKMLTPNLLAFAAQSIAVKTLGPDDKVNVNGGAIALVTL